MKYHELTTSSKKSKRRLGRGIAAGQGKTAGRGTKGQMSRAGARKRPGFEGGQNPLLQRMPKLHGFRSYRHEITLVYTGQLEALQHKNVNPETLAKAQIIEDEYSYVKLVVRGKLTKPLNIKLASASAMAVQMVEKAGGSFVQTPQTRRPKTTTKKDNT